MDYGFMAVQSTLLFLLAAHDWVPLGPFNDLRGVRSQVSRRRAILGTIGNCLPIGTALALSVAYSGQTFPLFLKVFLVVVYGLFLVGEIRAWWKPYLFGADPAVVERYRAMFGSTHTLLPKRGENITPNTLHVVIHSLTLVAFLMAVYLAFRG